MISRTAGLVISVVLLTTCVAQAEVTNVKSVLLDPGELLPGFVTNDIFVDFDGILRGQQLVLELTQGSIFQQGTFGSNTAPQSIAFDYAPEVAFDTFVTVGGATAEQSAGVFVVGGAANLRTRGVDQSSTSFNTETLNIAWAPAPGTDIPASFDFLTARITLSNDAQGTFRYFGSTSEGRNDWIGGALIQQGTIGTFSREIVEPPVNPLPPPLPPSIPPPLNPPSVNPLPPVAGPGGVRNVKAVQIDPGEALPGFVANDITVDFDHFLRGQQMILELTQGSIFQETTLGTNTSPERMAIEFAPEAAFDTFVTVGGATASDSAGVLVVGGAVNLDSKLGRTQFDSEAISITWAPSPGTNIDSGTDFLTARITLSEDAQGRFRYFGSTSAGLGGTDPDWIGEASIIDGVIGEFLPWSPPAPEPPPRRDPPPSENPRSPRGEPEMNSPIAVIPPEETEPAFPDLPASDIPLARPGMVEVLPIEVLDDGSVVFLPYPEFTDVVRIAEGEVTTEVELGYNAGWRQYLIDETLNEAHMPVIRLVDFDGTSADLPVFTTAAFDDASLHTLGGKTVAFLVTSDDVQGTHALARMAGANFGAESQSAPEPSTALLAGLAWAGIVGGTRRWC